jgi:DNA-binding NarL/FixJ family response regulator
MIRIVLADDQALVRRGIELLLSLEPDLEVVATAGDGHEAIAAVERHHPDVVLMDIQMPNLDGVAATQLLAERFPQVPVIILTTFTDREYVVEGLKAGARGYLLKDSESEVVAEAVRVVAAGGALIQPSVTRTLLDEFARLAAREGQIAIPEATAPADPPAPGRHPAGLTAREVEVLRLVADGLTDGQIAERLFVSARTVGQHLRSVYNKLGVDNRSAATRYAVEHGLI